MDDKGVKVPVTCRGEVHDVFIHRHGGAVFLNHDRVRMSALATEYMFLEDEKDKEAFGCGAVAAAIRGDVSVRGLPLWFVRQLEGDVWQKQMERKLPLQTRGDWLKTPFAHRVSQVCMQKALEQLDQMAFRTTHSTGHIVRIVPVMGRIEPAVLECRGTSGDTLPGRKKKAAIKQKQYVSIRLNLKQWARVWRYKAGLVEGHFVLRVFKQMCDNQLVVDMLHQSIGYQVTIRRATIRRAHDGVWHIHEM